LGSFTGKGELGVPCGQVLKRDIDPRLAQLGKKKKNGKNGKPSVTKKAETRHVDPF